MKIIPGPISIFWAKIRTRSNFVKIRTRICCQKIVESVRIAFSSFGNIDFSHKNHPWKGEPAPIKFRFKTLILFLNKGQISVFTLCAQQKIPLEMIFLEKNFQPKTLEKMLTNSTFFGHPVDFLFSFIFKSNITINV
jgi:hypothetical protein